MSEVYSIPLTTRFRGIEVREGVLLRGEAGHEVVGTFKETGSGVRADRV